MKRRLRSVVASVAAALVPSMLGCACPKVDLPASDSTPPSLTWELTNKATNSVHTFATDGSFTAKRGQKYSVKMTASDSGGVHEASLYDETSYTCVSGSVASTAGPGLGIADVEKHDVWPSGQVCSEIVQYRDLDFSLFDCNAGYEFVGGTSKVHGEGKNFHGGVTSGVLTITIVP